MRQYMNYNKASTSEIYAFAASANDTDFTAEFANIRGIIEPLSLLVGHDEYDEFEPEDNSSSYGPGYRWKVIKDGRRAATLYYSQRKDGTGDHPSQWVACVYCQDMVDRSVLDERMQRALKKREALLAKLGKTEATVKPGDTDDDIPF